MLSRFIHVVACMTILFPFKADWYSTVCTHILFIHSSDDRHLGCFHFLGIVNNAVTNISVKIPVLVLAFNSFGYVPRSEIAGSYGNTIFNFSRNHHAVFYRRYTILCSHNQCTRFSMSPYPAQHVIFCFCFVILFYSSHLNECEVTPAFENKILLKHSHDLSWQYFCAIVAELSSYDRDSMVQEAKNIYHTNMLLNRKRLLVLNCRVFQSSRRSRRYTWIVK